MPWSATPAELLAVVQVLLDNDVAFGVKRQTFDSTILQACRGVFALWLPVLPFLLIFKHIMDSQGGKGKKQKQSFEPPGTTFADVAGIPACRQLYRALCNTCASEVGGTHKAAIQAILHVMRANAVPSHAHCVAGLQSFLPQSITSGILQVWTW